MLEFLIGLPALILLLIGILALIAKGTFGGYARAITGVIPIGNPKLWAMIFIVAGLLYGGIAYGSSLFNGAAVSTATFGGDDSAVSGITGLACTIGAAGATSGTLNATGRADTSSLSHYYVDTHEGSAAASVQVNMTCNRGGDISKGAVATCIGVADSFRNELSTTDSNTYYIVETTASKSQIAGMPWAQKIYLQDNAVATTSSSQEKVQLTFAQDEATQALDVLFTLPGNTVFNYLSNNSMANVRISCDGKEVGYVTVVKLGGTMK